MIIYPSTSIRGWSTCLALVAVSLFHLSPRAQSNTVSGNDITGVVTDYGGFWISEDDDVSPTEPASAHDLLAFRADGTYYSTGVDNAILSANGVTFVDAEFRAFSPLTATSANAGQGAADDGDQGSWQGQLLPTPGGDVIPYLTDGVNGMGFSTFANNAGGTFTFSVLEFHQASIGDGIPDIIYFNNAVGASTNVEFVFKNSLGAQLGSVVLSSEGQGRSTVGFVRNDRFKTATGAINSSNSRQGIQGFYLELSDFGLSAQDLLAIATLDVILPPQADPPFVGYNANSMVACATGDDDGDGVCNLDDSCPGTLAGLNVDSDGCPPHLDVDLSSNSEACAYAIVPFHLELVNNSGADAENLIVYDQLPSGFSFLADSIEYSSGASNDSILLPTEGQGALVWSGLNIPRGDTIIISYSALVSTSVSPGNYSNAVTIENATMSGAGISTTYTITDTQCQGATMDCEPAFYQVYKKRGGLNTYGILNPQTQAYDFIAYLSPQANGLGYDRVTELAYGSNGKRFISLDNEGICTYLGVDFNKNVYVGDTDTLGNWWGKDGGDMVRVNLTGLGLTRWPGQGLPGWDMAYNEDGNFYSVHNNTLYRFNTSTLTKSSLGPLDGDLPSGGYGAQWTGKDGYHYISNNKTGKIFRVDIETLDAVWVMQSESGLQFNDGFSCPSELPPIYSRDYSDNSHYPSASHILYVQDLNSDDIPDFDMAWSGAKVSQEDAIQSDTNAGADGHDDGLSFSTVLTPGQSTELNITLNTNISAGMQAYYGVWVDWNDDGAFDSFTSGDQFITGATSLQIPLLVPGAFTAGMINIRTRVTDQQIVNDDVNGLMLSPGEVEDYRYAASITPEICDNGIDDDGDGLTDCADPDCIGPSCREVCYNGLDDDGDGLIDEADSMCPSWAYNNCFQVNSTADTGDDDIGDGLCDDGTGNCTLRAAIEESNATYGYNCIELQVAGSIDLATPLVVTDSVLINGSTAPGYQLGDPVVSLHGNIDKIISISETGDVRIQGLDLSNPGATYEGYGIEVAMSQDITIWDNDIKKRVRGVHVNNSRDIIIQGNDLTDSGQECWDAAVYFNNLSANTLPGGVLIDNNQYGGLELDPQTILHVSNADGLIISDGSIPGSHIIMDGPYNSWHPIRLVDVNNASIKNLDLSFHLNQLFGIGLWTISCDNVAIDNVTITNRQRAIYINGGSGHTITGSDLRDSGSNPDNAALTIHNYPVQGNADLQVSGTQFGKDQLNVNTLLTLSNTDNAVISDGTPANSNITLNGLSQVKDPIRLIGSDNIRIQDLDFTYNGNSNNSRAILIEGNSDGTLIQNNFFKDRATAVHTVSAMNTMVSCNAFTRNRNGILSDGLSGFDLVSDNHFGCNEVAIHNRGSVSVDARANYWSDPQGSSSYSGMGDYYIGDVSSVDHLTSTASCAPDISINDCGPEQCGNGIDDDGDGVVDCDDGSCLGQIECTGGGMMAAPMDCGYRFTFDQDNEFWYLKRATGANLEPIRHALDNDMDQACAQALIPELEDEGYVWMADTYEGLTFIQSPDLDHLYAGHLMGGILEWNLFQHSPGMVPGDSGTMTITLRGTEGDEVSAEVEFVHQENWTRHAVPLHFSAWSTDSQTLEQVLMSIESIAIQFDPTMGTLSTSCDSIEVIAMDEVVMCFDTDKDGTPDYRDDCPEDPNKTMPGLCGCGMPDYDEAGNLNCAVTDPMYPEALAHHVVEATGSKGEHVLSKKLEPSSGALVYPNPSNGVFHVLIEQGIWEASVVDDSYRQVWRAEKDWEGGMQTVHLSDLPSGVYTLILRSSQAIEHACIVIR